MTVNADLLEAIQPALRGFTWCPLTGRKADTTTLPGNDLNETTKLIERLTRDDYQKRVLLDSRPRDTSRSVSRERYN